MNNFFDRFKPKKKSGGGFSLNLPGMNRGFQGEGKSLGGGLPGKVIEIQLSEPGSLGIKIEKRPGTNSAIVAMIVEGSQAEKAGLQRGDILCFQGSNGSEEILYDMFRELAASDQRPLCFEVRRVETKATKSGTTGVGGGKTSAETYARKQAMIAAAEKREKAAKARMKPLPPRSSKDLPTLRSTADRHREEAERLAKLSEQDPSNYSEASKAAAAAAKEQEAKLAAELGYNPYETSKASAGQARNATVASTHGTMSGGDSNAESIPVTTPPPALPVADETEDDIDVSADFQHAFEVCATSNDSQSVKSSFGILRKLITNATTKGQQADEATAQKFRKVRLANAKIKAAIVEVEGALDLMMSVGFQLSEEDGESVLTFPSGFKGENWLSKALRDMEKFEQSH